MPLRLIPQREEASGCRKRKENQNVVPWAAVDHRERSFAFAEFGSMPEMLWGVPLCLDLNGAGLSKSPA
jgi:hypothetical protein